ncbi:MAG: hypothetical protein AAGB12_13955 [Pseudomonadota bacterium]
MTLPTNCVGESVEATRTAAYCQELSEVSLINNGHLDFYAPCPHCCTIVSYTI